MEIKEITEWASLEIKTIRITQGFRRTPHEVAYYELEVREFKPVDGDVLEKVWNDKGVVKSHKIPPYGLVNMKKAACVLRKFVEGCIGVYIGGIVGDSDHLLWNTYVMAFRQSEEAQVSHEKFPCLRHARYINTEHRRIKRGRCLRTLSVYGPQLARQVTLNGCVATRLLEHQRLQTLQAHISIAAPSLRLSMHNSKLSLTQHC
jgi:hypothetical protein